MSFIKRAILQMQDITFNTINAYSHDEGYPGDENLSEDLREINNLYNRLYQLLDDAKKEAEPLPISNEKDDLSENLTQDLKSVLNSLKEKITTYRENNPEENEPECIKKMISLNNIYNIDNAVHCIDNHFTSFMMPADITGENAQKRDIYIRNLEYVNSNPKGYGRSQDNYGQLSEDEQQKYARLMEYWWNDVKNNGFDATMDFLVAITNEMRHNDQPLSKGENVAINDIMYTVFAPVKSDGSPDNDLQQIMYQGLADYKVKHAIEEGKEAEKYIKDHPKPVRPENADKEQLKQYKKDDKAWKTQVTKAMMKTKAGGTAFLERALAAEISDAVRDRDEYNKSIAEYELNYLDGAKLRLNVFDKKAAEQYKLATELQTHAGNAFGADEAQELDDYIRAVRDEKQAVLHEVLDRPLPELNKVTYDRNANLLDKCAVLNKLCAAFEENENGYIGHTNSGRYKEMVGALQKLRSLTEESISKGERITDQDKRIQVQQGLIDVETTIGEYFDNNLKAEYSHSAGEERRNIAICALAVVNPDKAMDYVNAVSDGLERAGKPELKIEDLTKKYGGVNNGIIKNQQIKNFADDFNGKLTPQTQNLRIDDNLVRMLQKPQGLDSYKELFNTKHHARIIRWNSGLYNDTKKAVENFQKYRNRVADRISGKLPENDAKLKKDIEKLQKYYKKCNDLLPRYCDKVLGDSNDAMQKSRSAGMARAVGASGALAEFTNFRVQRISAVQQKSIHDIYQKLLGENKMDNKGDRHRKAAAAAKELQKAVEAGRNSVM